MRKGVLLLVTFLSVAGLVKAEDIAQEPELGVTLDFTYTTKWLSKGVEAYKSQGGAFETLDLDFYGTGLGVKVTHRNALSSGFVDSQRFDYRPYYKGSLFEGQYTTNYNISVGYEHYYGRTAKSASTTYEWICAFAWPELIGNGFVPKYIAHYEHPAHGASYGSGWVHRFVLDYNIDLEQLSSPLKFSSELAYYDGLGNRVHDWAYATFGLSTVFDLGNGLSFIPGIYQQQTLDKNISQNRDITYGMFSMRYAF